MTLTCIPLTGDKLIAVLDDVARLRIRVFREWPYLYDGSLEYEQAYLDVYRKSPGAIVVGAFDGDTLVGAATGTPLEDHAPDFVAALEGSGLDIAEVFYCAESILLPDYRGQGAGHRFFDLREAHARGLNRKHVSFCSVIRPFDHPLRPANYSPLDDFWRKRGYEKLDGAVAEIAWQDIGDSVETRKSLQFWIGTPWISGPSVRRK